MQDASKPIWINKKENKSTTESKPVIFVATPVHSECSIHYTQSLLLFQQNCIANGIMVSFSLLKSSLVTQGRNLCVNSFMEESQKSNYTHMLFIDSDIEFSFKTIIKMIQADKDVIANPYPLKTLDWDKIKKRIDSKKDMDADSLSKQGYTWPIKLEGKENIKVVGGVAEVTHAPTGCMLIKKEVFDIMIDKYPNLKISQPTIVNGKCIEKEFMYNFFDCYHDPDNKKYYGEDFGFCKRWTEIGGKCHILVEDYITHVGEYRYTGRLMDDLQFKKD
jgi:hypothetical protein